MLNKTFIQCLFGTPHNWLEPYFQHFGRLESTGWRMKIFTPHQFEVPKNIDIIPMTLGQFDQLVEAKCGVNPKNYMNGHAPRKLISDYYCAFGHIFEDYFQEFTRNVDYWGITNFDVVYGRLSKFIPDAELKSCDIWADEGSVAINGIFTLFRNDPKINWLYKHVPRWEDCFTTYDPCGFDEIRMTHVVRKLATDRKISVGHPEHFPMHSYDRLVQHVPTPNLYFEPDGALIEKFDDQVHFPNERGHYGREIFLFHFSRTKTWPINN